MNPYEALFDDHDRLNTDEQRGGVPGGHGHPLERLQPQLWVLPPPPPTPPPH